MLFEEFKKQLGSDIKPEEAHRIYVQTKLIIIETFLQKMANIDDESWANLEKKVFERVFSQLNKK